MANLISVERATLALGTAQVLDAVSLGINEGDRIGIVGRNGGGKTTLLKVLHGDVALDDGRITRSGWRPSACSARTTSSTLDPTVREVVLRRPCRARVGLRPAHPRRPRRAARGS
jgi:ATP-binding cassette subfamily F protein uup